jgi:2-keto-4-pentenoate hydratase
MPETPRPAAEIADRLMADHAARRPFGRPAVEQHVGDLETAYRIQDALVARLLAGEAAPPAGFKVALTSARMQALCGIDQPTSGVILASRVHRSGLRIAAADFVRLGLECELCLRLGSDVPPRPRPFTAEEMAPLVSGVAPAFELVEDRAADYAVLEALSLVMDNCWNGGIVVGDFVPVPADLAAAHGVLRGNGTDLDEGHARDVMGHPFAALAWLLTHLSSRGRTVPAGSLVMTGSLVPTRFADAGTDYRFEVVGVGAVALSVR